MVASRCTIACNSTPPHSLLPFQALYTQTQAEFGTYVASGTLLNNYSHVFELLIRLRQVRAVSIFLLLKVAAYPPGCLSVNGLYG